jgi:hypothetical protein
MVVVARLFFYYPKHMMLAICSAAIIVKPEPNAAEGETPKQQIVRTSRIFAC